MKDNHKMLKKFCALLLSVALVITYMPTSMLAYAEDTSGQTDVVEEVTETAAETVAEETETAEPEAPAEEAEPAEAEQQSEAASETDSVEEQPAEEVAEDSSAETEETQEAEVTEDAEAVEETEEVEESEETEEEEFKDGTLEVNGGDYSVTVTYSAEAKIPENATLQVEEIKDGWAYDKYLDKTSEKLDQNVPYARFFDITILDEEGNEVQPEAAVDVDIQLGDLDASVATMDNVELSAVHFKDESDVEKVDVDFNKKSESVDFSAEGFSVYGVAYTYTVDFYYTAGDEDSTVSYSMAGGSTMPLSVLFAKLGIEEDVNDIESITSAPLDGAEVALEERVTFTKQFGGDYEIASLAPFEDWYYVTITMADGTQYVIGVTDAYTYSDGRTVDHIDIAVTATADITVPLAYGTYYDSTGKEILTVDIGQHLNASGYNYSIDITSSDLMAAEITAEKNDEEYTNFTAGSSYSTSTGTDPDSGDSIDQVRIGGTYPIGTYANPVTYHVAVDKEFELTLQYDVDGDGDLDTLYDSDGEPVTLTVTATLIASFNYWTEGNMCPPIRMSESSIASWEAGNYINGSGMDFILGTSSDTSPDVTAIEIIKYIVDESGQILSTTASYDFDFDVYQNESGDVTAPAAWSGAYDGTVNYTGYTKLSDRTATTSTDGVGIVYDYDVGDPALVYIVEDSSTIPATVETSDGETLKYKSTYIETEYAWRNDDGETHSNINQDDTYTAIPDVVGDYYSEDYDGDLRNTFLEFYVYNVYAPATGDLTVSKTVVSDAAADADQEFTFTVTLSDTTINGTYGDMTFADGVATITLKGGESKTAEDLPTGVTYTVTETAVDGFTTTKTGDTGTISSEESKAAFTNTRQTGDLTVKKTVVSPVSSDSDKEFTITVTLGDTTISGTYGGMTFTNGVATLTLKDGASATAEGLPTGITYTVTETTADGFTATYSGQTGTISTTASTATVTNTRETGDLEVSKTVVSNLAADADQEFTFTVTLSDTTISGTFGDMTFTNGVATVTLKGGESAKATGLPTGITYTVTETEVSGFTTEKTGDTGTISTTASTAAFTNTRETGDLEVSKTVVSDLAADADQEFTFTVTLSDTSISGTYGDMTFTDGVATVTLKGGETATAEGLPTTVTYTVTETAVSGFTTEKTGDTGTISTTASTAAFTNTRETGDLELSKTVVSDAAADKDAQFTFTVTLSDTSISGTFGDMNFTNGVATVTLKGGEKATATGLPTTVTYTITEAEAEGFTTEKTGDEGTITTTKSTAAFTNTRETGDLEVSKTVVSDAAADKNQEFTFTVTLSDTSISGTYGDMTFTDGVATFTLKGGESATATGLPTGVTYTVEETAEDGFTSEYDSNSGTISTTKSTSAFTNTRATSGLVVNKTVVSDAAADKDQEFTFTVTLSDTTISGTYGDMTFENGVATVTLKGGESATAEGLPTGITYTVEETAVDGFTTTSEGESGSITADKAATAAFTNTRETGDLEVSKTVVSDAAADKNQEFTFTVTLSDTTINGTYGGMTFENGVATVTLKGGEKATATGLPTGVTYTVAETAVDGFTTEKTGDEGTISTTKSTAAFTNTRETGDLEVSKTVVSDAAADADQEFTFTVTLSDTTISGTYGDMTFEDGVATVTLKGGESATAEGLPTGVTYTVTETAVDGFTTTSEGDSGTISTTASTAAFTNTRETGDLTVSKTVVSDLAADADQEFTFTVTLSDTTISGTYGDMTFENGVATVTLKGGESATAEGLPTGVTYTVAETAVDGFTTEKNGDTGTITTDGSTAAFTNTRETGELDVSKIVVSDAAADKDAQFTFTVTLSDTSISGTYGDMTFENGVATVTLKGGETAKATGLPTTVTYTVTEAEADGFTTEKTGDTGTITTTKSTATFTNTREKGDLTVSKTVVSDAAADKNQEFTFTVTLSDTSISGTYGDMTFEDGVATFTLKGGESATATGLPTGVTYSVAETAVDGFTTEYDSNSGTISTEESESNFTNTRVTSGLVVNKTVVSDAAADKDQEFTFTVTLSDTSISGTYGDMTFEKGVATVTLKGGESAAAEKLPTGITYTVEETAVDGFTTEKTGDSGTITEGDAATAAFTNTRETGDLEVSKTVVSDLAADANQEFTFTVTLSDTTINGTYGEMSFTDGVATVVLKDGESATAEGLPTSITYTVTETAVDGFTTKKTGDTGTISTTKSTAAFTNTRETGDLEVSKTVVSDLAADKDQEFTFTVTLGDTSISGTYGDMTFENGVATVTLKGGESAKATGLPTTVTYTVEETAVDGFTTTSEGESGSISADETATAAFTNTRETGDLEVSKTVVSDLAADKDQEFEFTVTLGDTSISGTYGDMTFENGVATVTLKGGESAKATGLPTTVTYTVEETTVDGFTTTSEGESGTISADETATAAFTNTRETGDLEVVKEVESDLAADADQEFEFTVTLGDTSISGTYGDMTFTDGVATVTLKGGESAKATGLPTTVTYTVEETAADGFTTTSEGESGEITADETATAVFTNTRETGDLEVSKTVESDLAIDKKQEFTFTVTLGDTSISGEYGDMTFSSGVATFTLKDGETATAEGLPTTVTYTVEEEAVNGFTTAYTGNEGSISTEISSASFINTSITTEVTVSKTWDDADDQDGKRPESITFTLTGTADGEEVITKEQTVTESDDWTYTWTKLPTYYAEKEVTYAVTEAEVDGYTTTVGELTEVTDDSGNVTGYTVEFTNAHTPAVTKVTVYKKWDDEDDEDGIRPGSINVILYADGSAVGDPVSLSDDNDWSYTWEDLDAYADGEEISYTVDETAVPDEYTKEVGDVEGDVESGYEVTITNSYEPEDDPPKTGDNNNLAGWLMLMALAGAGGAGLLIRRRREED